MDNMILIEEARKRDKEIMGKRGLLSQLADALEEAEKEILYLNGEIAYLVTGVSDD